VPALTGQRRFSAGRRCHSTGQRRVFAGIQASRPAAARTVPAG